MPYNPHSQGVVERYHQTIKDILYNIYDDNKNTLDLKECLDYAVKLYNNHRHSSTLFSPNELFYSKDKNVFETVFLKI